MYRVHHGALCQWQCFRCFRHDVQTVANCSVEPLLLLSILSIKSSFIHNIWSLWFSCAHHHMWLNLLSADVEADDLAMTFLKVWQFGLSSYLQSWSQLIYLHHSIGCMTSLPPAGSCTKLQCSFSICASKWCESTHWRNNKYSMQYYDCHFWAV